MMTTGSILVLLSLVLLVIWYLTQPFLSTPHHKQGPTEKKELQTELEYVLNLIQILDLDHDMLKIPENDYLSQHSQLELQVQKIEKKLTELSNHKDETPEDPKHIQTNGKVQRPVLEGDPIEALIARKKRARLEKTTGFCPKCGNPFSQSDKYCPKCGIEISDEAR